MQTTMAPLKPAGERLRQNLALFREQAKLSRAQLAAISGIPEKNIVRYEAGDTGIPAEALDAFAHVFGRAPGDFYADKPPAAPKPETLDDLFLSTRPDVDIPDEILRDVRKAIDDANERWRAMKMRRK